MTHRRVRRGASAARERNVSDRFAPDHSAPARCDTMPTRRTHFIE
jgi:hypothetical protein